MPSVIYAPEADDDLEGIVEFIARDKPTAATDWLQNYGQHARRCQNLLDWAKRAKGLASEVTPCFSGPWAMASKSRV